MAGCRGAAIVYVPDMSCFGEGGGRSDGSPFASLSGIPRAGERAGVSRESDRWVAMGRGEGGERADRLPGMFMRWTFQKAVRSCAATYSDAAIHGVVRLRLWDLDEMRVGGDKIDWISLL